MFRADVPKAANVINVYAETGKDGIEAVSRVLQQLPGELRDDYALLLESKRMELEKRKMLLRSEIMDFRFMKEDLELMAASKKAEINFFRDQKKTFLKALSLMKARERELVGDITAARRGTEILGLEGEPHAGHNPKEKHTELERALLASNLQQNITLVSQLQEQLNELRIRMTEVSRSIIDLERLTQNNRVEVERNNIKRINVYETRLQQKTGDMEKLEKRVQGLKAIEVLSEPSATKRPVQKEWKRILGFP